MNNLAWALSETEASRSAREEALQLAQRGLAIDPNYTDLIDTRGQIYYRLGQHEKAVEDFQRCVGQFRAGSRAAITCRVNLARAYHELGRKTQAREQLRRAAAEAAEGLKRLESDARFEQYPDRRAYAIDAMEEALNREDEIWRQYPDMVADVNALLAQRQKGG
jgi:tetratricopeptide (TPR) repeat protein